MSNTPKNFLAFTKCQLVATPNTETSVPALVIDPRNPQNNAYFSGINKLGFISAFVRGRNTPALQLSSYLHSGFISPALLNSWLCSFDANNDSNAYNWLINDGTTGGTLSNRVFGGARCAAMSISGMNTGPQSLDMAWLAQTGNSNATFASGYTPITGQCYDAAVLDFNGTADLVDGYRIMGLRGQAYEMFFTPGSYDPSGVSSGMLGGTLELIQSPQYTLTPGSTFVVRYFANTTNAAAGTSPILTATCKINFDEQIYTEKAAMGRVLKRYTLADVTSGSNPLVFS